MQSTELKIATVIGARPQFIKAAAISRAIAGYNKSQKKKRVIKEIIIHTGQHYDEKMSKLFFDELNIPKPDYNLEVGSASHGAQTGAMLAGIEEVLLKEKPDIVLTYGDTNSTLAGALAAAKLHILSGHVEAGLRSFNRRMPEEINRIVADRVSNILFCPTETAIQNLEKEGIQKVASTQATHLDFKSQVALNVGDVMYDSILYNETLSRRKSKILAELELISKGRTVDMNSAIRPNVHPYCLATVHRPENTDNPENLSKLLRAFSRIATGYKVILPLHPRTAKCLREIGKLPENNLSAHSRDTGLTIIDPVGYLDMIQLEKSACAILTDSGGVQKEAFILRTACITLRNETEWVETVHAGWNTMTGADPDKIQDAFFALERWDRSGAPFDHCVSVNNNGPEIQSPYGEGKAAEKILKILSAIGNA